MKPLASYGHFQFRFQNMFSSVAGEIEKIKAGVCHREKIVVRVDWLYAYLQAVDGNFMTPGQKQHKVLFLFQR